jgi:hypothetical protein
MEISELASQLAPRLIREIQRHYLDGNVIRTNDCVNDMIRDQLTEADIEKVIMDATMLEKILSATSLLASNIKNTHYVIYGECTKGKKVYCKICTNYHPETGEFTGWRLTSFCISRK